MLPPLSLRAISGSDAQGETFVAGCRIDAKSSGADDWAKCPVSTVSALRADAIASASRSRIDARETSTT